MIIFPAIDLIGGKAVRLLHGDYRKMTVYSEHPEDVARDFVSAGATHIHLVDLEGAKSGDMPNFATICRIREASGVFCEVGGGIRDMEKVSRYLDSGIQRVILGTAAVQDPAFAEAAVKKYGNRIAVGVDLKDGFVAVKGWTEKSGLDAYTFCRRMQEIGVETIICTDISKDGAMQGTNRELYQQLSSTFSLHLVASGGVSSLSDILYLKELGMYGAIIGKAYYTGAVDLAKAIEVAA